MFKRVLFAAIFAYLIFVNIDASFAATTLSGLEIIREEVEKSIALWTTKAAIIATWLLGATFVITYVWELYKLAISGQLEFGGVIATLVRLLMTVGIFYWFAENPEIIKKVPDSFVALGKFMEGADPSPGGVIKALSTCVNAFNKVELDWLDIIPGIVLGACAVGVSLMGFYIAGQIICVQIEMTLVFVGGFFTVGLAGTPIFRDYFFGYLKGLAICGVKLMLYSLIVSLMLAPMSSWAKNLTEAGITTGGIVETGLGILGMLFVFCMIVNSVPGYAASILLGGGSQGGLGGVFSGAAAAMNMASFSGKAVSSVASKASSISGSIGNIGTKVDTAVMGTVCNNSSVMMSRNVNPKTDSHMKDADGSI